MNKKQAASKIMDLLERKPEIMAPSRFLPHIANEIGSSSLGKRSTAEMAAVEAALLFLERTNKVELIRAGKVLTGIKRKQSHRQPVRPITIRHKGDDVVPTDVVPCSEEMSASAEVITYRTGEFLHETLTACLQALRAEADETGKGQEGMGVKFVLEAAGLTESQADHVLAHLRALELYVSKMTDFAKSTYMVALEPSEVTLEMVAVSRAKIRAKKSDNMEVQHDEQAGNAGERLPAGEAPDGTASGNEEVAVMATDDPFASLVEIVGTLEQQNADLMQANMELSQENSNLKLERNMFSMERAAFESQLIAAREEITQLNEQLIIAQNEPKAVPLPVELTDLLSRYGK